MDGALLENVVTRGLCRETFHQFCSDARHLALQSRGFRNASALTAFDFRYCHVAAELHDDVRIVMHEVIAGVRDVCGSVHHRDTWLHRLEHLMKRLSRMVDDGG